MFKISLVQKRSALNTLDLLQHPVRIFIYFYYTKYYIYFLQEYIFNAATSFLSISISLFSMPLFPLKKKIAKIISQHQCFFWTNIYLRVLKSLALNHDFINPLRIGQLGAQLCLLILTATFLFI